MRKKIIILTSTIALISGIAGCGITASSQREWKSMYSDFTGGLNRTITVYDYNGQPLKSWSGKFDVSSSEKEVYFDDQNGKRIIIHGGIVINEEN